jgi:hypothetical protein
LKEGIAEKTRETYVVSLLKEKQPENRVYGDED